MRETDSNSRPRSRTKKNTNPFFYVFFVVIIVFVIFFYFYIEKEPVQPPSIIQDHANNSVENPAGNDPNVSKTVSQRHVKMGSGLQQPSIANPDSEAPLPNVNSLTVSSSASSPNTETVAKGKASLSTSPNISHASSTTATNIHVTGGATDPANSADAVTLIPLLNTNTDSDGTQNTHSTAVVSKSELTRSPFITRTLESEVADPISRDGMSKIGLLIKVINDFYAHLDQQEYMKAFNLQVSSRIHFSKLLQKLVDNPPVVTRETDDLFTILKNTAHFFRILGKDNILILKGILDREKMSFENILQTFYTLTYYPDALAKEYSITLSQDALYDYAGFFLNTMGGRLYLFRRDSTSRMTVSFYAIDIIDNANDNGLNRHGLDIKPAIDFLIDEIENAGNRLKLKDEYLDRLYDLKEKYN